MDAMTGVDLTVVLNVHREGRLVHPTVRSIGLALGEVVAAGRSAELVVVLDRADEATRDYVSSIPDRVPGHVEVRALEVEHGDLGLSRNSGAAAARGRWIAFCDADNLVSRRWFASALDILAEETGDVVVHPAFVVAFEARDTIWRIRSTRDADFDARVLAQSNLWDASCVTTTDLARRFPYTPTHVGQGFGPEDWHWNIEVLAAGGEHLVADATALFYRAKSRGSLLAGHEAADAMLPPTAFLRTTDALRAGTVVEVPQPTAPRPRLMRRVVKSGYRLATRLFGERRDFKRLSSTLRRVAPEIQFARQPAPSWAPLPEWLIEEWSAAHALEPELFPEPGLLHVVDYWDPMPTSFADIYWSLVAALEGTTIDLLYLVPWLKQGGADQATLNYVDAVVEASPDARVVVLATEAGASEWAARLPDTVEFLVVPDAFHALQGADQERLLGQVLIQIAPRRVHVINSHVGFRLLRRYSRVLSISSGLYVSAFTLDEWESGRRWHYILDGVRDYIDHVQSVITDNTGLRDELIELFALPPERLAVHRQPIPPLEAPARRSDEKFDAEHPMRVLWAGRFDRQKRLDILGEIAAAARAAGLPVEFHVYGRSVLGDDDATASAVGHQGAILHGAFDGGLPAIGLGDYHLFLMTSQWEGLPISLLEAMASELPALVPAVGGIPDIATVDTATLVEDFADVPAYVEALQRVLEDYPAAIGRARTSRALVGRRHSRSGFAEALRETPGYLP